MDLKVPNKVLVTRCLIFSIKAKRKSEDNFGRIELRANLWKSMITGSWVNLRNLFTACTASYLCAPNSNSIFGDAQMLTVGSASQSRALARTFPGCLRSSSPVPKMPPNYEKRNPDPEIQVAHAKEQLRPDVLPLVHTVTQ